MKDGKQTQMIPGDRRLRALLLAGLILSVPVVAVLIPWALPLGIRYLARPLT
jgi:hypothetical protein